MRGLLEMLQGFLMMLVPSRACSVGGAALPSRGGSLGDAVVRPTMRSIFTMPSVRQAAVLQQLFAIAKSVFSLSQRLVMWNRQQFRIEALVARLCDEVAISAFPETPAFRASISTVHSVASSEQFRLGSAFLLCWVRSSAVMRIGVCDREH